MTPNPNAPSLRTTARFTAPANGLYDADAIFKNSRTDGAQADVKVLVNGAEVDSGQISGFGHNSVTIPYAGPDAGSIHNYASAASIPLNAGETIDFAIGSTNLYHQVDFNAVVVPEPITLSLLGLGGLALIRRRR